MKSWFSFQGTICPTRFWLDMLKALAFAISILFSLGLSIPIGTVGSTIWFPVLLFGFFWVFLTLHAKRLRDAGLSPWFCLLCFVPLANLVVFLIAGFKPTAVKKTGAPMRLD